jgi:TRAP-type C4-dicarboxylate transport system substrate-binding protein
MTIRAGIARLLAAAVLFLAPGLAKAAEFEWSFYSFIPAGHYFAKHQAAVFKELEQESGGRLSIRFVPFGDTPYKSVDGITILRDGLVEMVEWCPARLNGTYPPLGAPELPFLSPEFRSAADLIVATNAAWDSPGVKQTVDDVLAQHKAIELARYYYEPANMFFTESVTSLADFAGQTIRVFQPEQSELLAAVGASPVTMDANDVYTALQRGTLTGVTVGSGGLRSFKWDEVLRSAYVMNMHLITCGMLVSQDSLAKLPADLQQLYMAKMQAIGDDIQAMMAEGDERNFAAMKDLKFTITQVTPEDYAKLRALAADLIWPKWKARTGAGADEIIAGVERAMSAH